MANGNGKCFNGTTIIYNNSYSDCFNCVKNLQMTFTFEIKCIELKSGEAI